MTGEEQRFREVKKPGFPLAQPRSTVGRETTAAKAWREGSWASVVPALLPACRFRSNARNTWRGRDSHQPLGAELGFKEAKDVAQTRNWSSLPRL